MTRPDLPWEGGCLCGQVRFRISAPPILTMACHCKGCQRLTSGPFSLSAAIPSTGFEVTRGETVVGALHGPNRHDYCPNCMSWMFTRPAGMDWFVNVRPTLLDDASWFEPFIETGMADKLPWATTPAVHGFEGFPPFEAYAELSREFAERFA